MKLKVCAARDVKASAFLQPFVTNSLGTGMRLFGDSCADVKSVFNKHPEDFMLFEIGDYDDETGLLSPVVPPKLVCSATDFVQLKVTGSPAVVRTDLGPDKVIYDRTEQA